MASSIVHEEEKGFHPFPLVSVYFVIFLFFSKAHLKLKVD